MRFPVDDEFLALVETAFPKEPVPDRFFHDDLARFSQPGIPAELSNRIEGRCWVDLTILDWRMIGARPVVCRSYLEPTTFIYYLPSLLVGVFLDTTYIDIALEAIIPHNKFHIPRGTGGALSTIACRKISARFYPNFFCVYGAPRGTTSIR